MSLKPSIGQIVNPFFLQDGQDANPSAVSYPLNVADGVKGGSSAVDPLSLDIEGLPAGTLATTTELAINNGAVNEKTTLSDLATFLGGGGSSYIPPFLKTGGASWSGTGLVYDVTTLEYYFNGDKTTNATQVTLDASDPVNNRLDAIVVDEAGVVSVIKGDASASPISPSVDESHILIQYILVEAGSTQPTIAKEDIYLENVEWTTSTYTTGAATGAIDFDNAVSPKQGVKCISANADARLGARFVRTTSFDPYQYTMLSMWVRFTGSNVATNKSLNVRFENGAGALVANTINLFNFGLQRNLLNVWQLVVIPITSFGALPTSVKGLKIIMTGGTVGQARQWDIDLISLTDNSVPAINEQVFNVLKDGALVGQSSSLNFKGGAVNVTKDAIGGKIDIEVISGGGSSPITIGTSGNTLYSSGFANTGEGDTTIGNNIFLGDYAGGLSNSVSYSNIFGFGAGYGISGSIQNMNVFGRQAGLQANNSANSNFIGVFAGSQSTNSFLSNFIGADAGNNADQSFGANFIGAGAGSQSENSAFSNFIGYQAGNNMTASYANDSIFIGTGAGAGDNISNYGQISYSSLSGTFTVGEQISSSSGGSAYIMFDGGSDLRIANVQGDFNINDTITGDDSGATANLDYFETSKSSILIGNNTSTADYYNSIAIGNGATNTENNQMIIESTKGLERFKLKLDQSQQSTVTFTGSGLDDLTVSGLFTGTVPTTYTVTVASTGTPDTFDWTDGTNTGTGVSMSTSPISLSNGISISFGADTGHTLTDSWTWTYSNVQNNILDFSNGTYKFGTDFGTDYFGYEVGKNILGFGLNGAVNTYTNTAGDSMITGYTDVIGLGLIGFTSLNSYSTGEIASMSANKNGVGYSMQDSFGENVVQTSSGITTLGNLSGGNNTKITIDDVTQLITISNVPTYADDAAAATGGLTTGQLYKTTTLGTTSLNIVP